MLEPGHVIQIQLADAASVVDIRNWAQAQAIQCQQNQTQSGVVLEFFRTS